MELLLMLISFIVACVVINVCLTKKQMMVARAVFLAFGIAIGTCSAFLIYANWQWSQVAHLSETVEAINDLVTVLLSVSTIVFDVVTLVITIATIILSVHAIRKIAEYIKSHKHEEQQVQSKTETTTNPVFASTRKIFVLHCRWNN